MECRLCGALLVDCPDCNDDELQFRAVICGTCNNTGLVCPIHGGEWIETAAASTDSS